MQLDNKIDNVNKELTNDIETINSQLDTKLNKNELTNSLIPKGTCSYSLLPSKANIGDYWYCDDVNPKGNYIWNGDKWYFGGNGDNGFNVLLNTIKNIEFTPDYKIYNLFDKTKCVKGYYIDNFSKPTTEILPLSYTFYNFVKIYGAGDYYIKLAIASLGSAAKKISLYNSNKEEVFKYSDSVLISGSGNDSVYKISITNELLSLYDIHYIGYNQAISKIDELMITLNEYPNQYVPYNNYTEIPSLVINKEQIIDNDDNPANYKGEEVRVFTKGFFGGDSLTKGTFNRNDTGKVTFEVIQKYSYPSYFGKMYGCAVSNWGIGGETTKSWYELVNADTRAKDYDFAVIALGANDIKINDNTVSKLYYQKIIDMLKTDVKNVKIFCCTVTPAYQETDPTFYNSYNENVVKAIVNENDNCYLIDLTKYSKCHKDSVYAQGHLTALGYLQQAKEIGAIISYIIKNNPNEFKYIHFIGTDYSFN